MNSIKKAIGRAISKSNNINNIDIDIETEKQKLINLREEITFKTKRLYDIFKFIKENLINEYPDEKDAIIIMTSLFMEDIKVILQQKDIDGYKKELREMSYELSDFLKDLGISKTAFFRKYKIWKLKN